MEWCECLSTRSVFCLVHFSFAPRHLFGRSTTNASFPLSVPLPSNCYRIISYQSGRSGLRLGGDCRTRLVLFGVIAPTMWWRAERSCSGTGLSRPIRGLR